MMVFGVWGRHLHPLCCVLISSYECVGTTVAPNYLLYSIRTERHCVPPPPRQDAHTTVRIFSADQSLWKD